VFKSEQILRTLYEQHRARGRAVGQGRTRRHVPGQRNYTPQLGREIGSRLSTGIEGTCIIKHKVRPLARSRSTTSSPAAWRIRDHHQPNVSFFKYHRKVEHRSGRATREAAPLRSPSTASSTCGASCSAATTPFLGIPLQSGNRPTSSGHSGCSSASRIAKPDGDRILRGRERLRSQGPSPASRAYSARIQIHGLARCDLMQLLPDLSPSRLSRKLRRLACPGPDQARRHTYRYYLTTFAIVPAPGQCMMQSSSFSAHMQ